MIAIIITPSKQISKKTPRLEVKLSFFQVMFTFYTPSKHKWFLGGFKMEALARHVLNGSDE